MHLAGHWSAVGEQLHCALLVLYIIITLTGIIIIIFPFHLSPIKLSLAQHINCIFAPHSLPHPTGWGEGQTSSCVVLSYLPG